MYSGISGLKNFQTKLDVIGNNIANVNTHGFKKSRTIFSDMISQTITGATAPTDKIGGSNPQQVGLGSSLSTIDTIHTQGSLQTTGDPYDVGISGDGYLVVDVDGTKHYTRAGNLSLDSKGNLVNGNGHFVLDKDGKKINIPDPDTIKKFGISKSGEITYIDKAGDLKTHPSAIGIARFKNNGGLEKAGDNYYLPSGNSGEPKVLDPGSEGAGELIAGRLEMSNVDLSEEFTEMIVAQRGFQANTRIITTSDEILQELVNLKR
jgi:flagellar hook protein FlgE